LRIVRVEGLEAPMHEMIEKPAHEERPRGKRDGHDHDVKALTHEGKYDQADENLAHAKYERRDLPSCVIEHLPEGEPGGDKPFFPRFFGGLEYRFSLGSHSDAPFALTATL